MAITFYHSSGLLCIFRWIIASNEILGNDEQFQVIIIHVGGKILTCSKCFWKFFGVSCLQRWWHFNSPNSICCAYAP